VKTNPTLFYGIIVEQSGTEVQVHGITFDFMHMSCLVHVCIVSGVLFQGWDSGTLGNTLSGCVTHDPRVGASVASPIHPTHTNVCV